MRVRQEAEFQIAWCYPIRSGYPYCSMRFWQRIRVKPAGQSGKDRQPNLINLQGKGRHGETKVELSKGP
jgi:hypothetical protein